MTPTNREARQWLKVQEAAARREMQKERQAAVDVVLRVQEVHAPKQPKQMRLV